MLFGKHRHSLIVILLLVLCIGQGCGSILPTSTPVTLPAETHTMTPGATETASPLPSVTGTSTKTHDPVATTDIVRAASIATIVATVKPYVFAQYPSADGKWLVEAVRYECSSYSNQGNTEVMAYEQLQLIDNTDGIGKVVADQLQNCGGLGTFGFEGLLWSTSNRYFYYNESREGHPDGGCGKYSSAPIYRLDTDTGEVLMMNEASISPDKTKLAMWQNHELVIMDLDQGEMARVTPQEPELFNGRIWWTSDNSSILYLQTEFQCAPHAGKWYLTQLDLANLSQKVVSELDVAGTEVPSTPVPAGVFVPLYYPSVIMNYDPLVWRDESLYSPAAFALNFLQAKELSTCSIAVQGSSTFNTPHSAQYVRLGQLFYTVIIPYDTLGDFVSHAYIGPPFLATDAGIPVFEVSARTEEWDTCKSLAEDVLSTLHFAAK